MPDDFDTRMIESAFRAQARRASRLRKKSFKLPSPAAIAIGIMLAVIAALLIAIKLGFGS